MSSSGIGSASDSWFPAGKLQRLSIAGPAAVALLTVLATLFDAHVLAYLALCALAFGFAVTGAVSARQTKPEGLLIGAVAMSSVLGVGLVVFIAVASNYGLIRPGGIVLGRWPELEEQQAAFARFRFEEASRNGQRAVAKQLAEQAPQVLTNEHNRNSLLLLDVVAAGHREMAEMLLVEGDADTRIVGDRQIEGQWYRQATPLVLAAARGDRTLTELLLTRGADPNTAGAIEQFPLALAASRGDIQLATSLLEAGAKVDSGAPSPLYFAASSGHRAVCELLLDRGADPNVVAESGAPLHAAVDRSDSELVRTLVLGGANINSLVAPNPWTNVPLPPLHRAVQAKDRQMVAMLLSLGADVNLAYHPQLAAGPQTRTPLDIAQQLGSEEIAALLEFYNAQSYAQLVAPKPPVPIQVAVPEVTSPVAVSEELKPQVEAAPVLIERIEPPTGFAGDLIRLYGRGFEDVLSVTFCMHYNRYFADYHVISPQEIHVRVPRHVTDLRRTASQEATITVATLRGVTVTMPAEPLVLDIDNSAQSIYAFQRNAPAGSRPFVLVRPGSLESLGGQLTAFLLKGSTLASLEHMRCEHFVQTDAAIRNEHGRPSGVVYFEPGAFHTVHRLRKAQLQMAPVVVPSPVASLFRFEARPEPPTKFAALPPVIRDVEPNTVRSGDTVVLRGEGFTGTTQVWTLTEGRPQSAHFWVVSDTELHVEVLYYIIRPQPAEDRVHFVIAGPHGIDAFLPPDVERLHEGVAEPSGDFAIAHEGATLPRGASLLTVVSAGASVHTGRGITLVKNGGRLVKASDIATFYEADAQVPDGRDGCHEVPAVRVHEAQFLLRPIPGSLLQHPACQPVAQMVESLRLLDSSNRKIREFRATLSTEANAKLGEKGTNELFLRQRQWFEKEVLNGHATELSLLAYAYAGNEQQGRVTVIYRNAVRMVVPVVKEDDGWKCGVPETLPPRAEGSDASRRIWKHANGSFRQVDGLRWNEHLPQRTLAFGEVWRTPQFVEINRDGGVFVRLYDDHADVKFPEDDRFRHLYQGIWQPAP